MLFQVAVEITQQPAVLTFSYTGPAFDTSDPSFVNDAFEAALVDGNGQSLVHTFATGRDAFFNITEGLAPALGSETTVSGQTVSVDLSGIPTPTSGLILGAA